MRTTCPKEQEIHNYRLTGCHAFYLENIFTIESGNFDCNGTGRGGGAGKTAGKLGQFSIILNHMGVREAIVTVSI